MNFKFKKEKECATEAGFEPAKEFPSRFLVYRLNRSAIQSFDELHRRQNTV
jgi:hypothetical protein